MVVVISCKLAESTHNQAKLVKHWDGLDRKSKINLVGHKDDTHEVKYCHISVDGSMKVVNNHYYFGLSNLLELDI